MNDGPNRPLTARQRDIAEGIGRGLSYKEIACAYGGTEQSIRQRVKEMALLFPNPDDLPPRFLIYVWVKKCEWDASHPPARSA